MWSGPPTKRQDRGLNSVLAFITAPADVPAYRMLTHDLVSSIRSLGAIPVLAESRPTTDRALTHQEVNATDSVCEAVDARVATIRQSDFLVALLDGAHPDVLVDIGLAYAQGTDCYGLQIHGETLEGLHISMLDGLLHTIPDLLAHLRRHLRLETPLVNAQPINDLADLR